MTDVPDGARLALRSARGRWLVVVTVLATGMVFLDASAVQVALPAIGREFGSSLSGLQWLVTGYTLTLASLILLGGSLGDRYGRRRVFLVGVVWFAVASLVCGLAQSTGQLVAARALQGIGGALLGSLALAGITYAAIAAGEHPVRADVLGAAAGGVLAAVAFVVRERSAAAPLLPPLLFRDRQFTGANAATLALFAALGGGGLLFVLQLQVVLGYDATAAGAAMLPPILLIAVFSPAAGALAQRIGPRLPMTVGPVVAAAGTLLLAGVDGSGPYWTEVLPGSLLQGVGLAITVAPLTATVLAAAPDAMAGVASGVNNAVARAGQLLAVAALPVAVGLGGEDYADPAAFTDGFRVAMVVCAGLFAVGGALSWATIRNDVLGSPGEPEMPLAV